MDTGELPIEETIKLPANTNIGKLIGRQGSKSEELRKQFKLESFNVKDGGILARGGPSAICSLKQNLRFEVFWILDDEDKDHEYWKECLEASTPGVVVKFAPPHTVYGAQSMTMIAARTTFVIEGTLEQQANAEHSRQRLSKCSAILRASLPDVKKWEERKGVDFQ